MPYPSSEMEREHLVDHNQRERSSPDRKAKHRKGQATDCQWVVVPQSEIAPERCARRRKSEERECM